MNPINVIPPLDFVYHINSSMGRERYVSVAEGYKGRSEWRKTYASTITPIQSHGGRKKTLEKSWRKRETFYAIRDIVDELATPMGNYVVGGQSINLFPYENEVITTFEKDKESQVIEKEIRTFNEIRYGEHLFKLMVPITAEAEPSTEGWILYHEDLSILAVAPTMEECIDGFQEYFYVLWEEYANKKDDELTDSGQILKHKLLDIIKK